MVRPEGRGERRESSVKASAGNNRVENRAEAMRAAAVPLLIIPSSTPIMLRASGVVSDDQADPSRACEGLGRGSRRNQVDHRPGCKLRSAAWRERQHGRWLLSCWNAMLSWRGSMS